MAQKCRFLTNADASSSRARSAALTSVSVAPCPNLSEYSSRAAIQSSRVRDEVEDECCNPGQQSLAAAGQTSGGCSTRRAGRMRSLLIRKIHLCLMKKQRTMTRRQQICQCMALLLLQLLVWCGVATRNAAGVVWCSDKTPKTARIRSS
jgi:hypothetical protein